MSTLVNEGWGGDQRLVNVVKYELFIRFINSNTKTILLNNLEISQGRRTFGLVKNLINLTENFCYPGFLVKYFCQRKRGRGVGGFAKCQHLSTRGREGVKNIQNSVNVVYERPLTKT